MATTMTGFTMKFLKHTDVLTYRCNVSVMGRTDSYSLENGCYYNVDTDLNDRDAPIKTRLEDCYKRYSLLNFCTRHSLYTNEFIKINKDTDDAILMLIPHLKEAFIQKAYDHHCEVKGCGTVLIFDADQKLTRKKCASLHGSKVMKVGNSDFSLVVKTGCLNTPIQTSSTFGLIKWQRYKEEENTWEPSDSIPNILINKFGRCDISGDVIRSKIINGTRMIEVKWNLDNDKKSRENTWVSSSSVDLIDERDGIENPICNTSKGKKRFHARTAGILVGGFPCGHVTMADEIFGTESLTQVTGHVSQNIENFPCFPDINCLVYDDACHLKKFVNKRYPNERISSLKLKCDRVHFKNHVDEWCLENCDPNKEILLENVNTETMEQLFSWLSSFSYMDIMAVIGFNACTYSS
ncbi:Hypothetical predicted protein [Mytilus galloprovincialis]|uniref:Chromo domain-containing protein n=1 Tax=Mytilus galloprovincialis TaxID=29158 RepID=A0A8B6FC76_MYTGA|nr:Hypothetical predicted protein [Mytilus galloprovincialis]